MAKPLSETKDRIEVEVKIADVVETRKLCALCQRAGAITLFEEFSGYIPSSSHKKIREWIDKTYPEKEL